MNILISACLLGEKCKYNGEDNKNEKLLKALTGHDLFPVCPERDGGLSIPRSPAERQGDKVVNINGEDVTSEYMLGALKALETAQKNRCAVAILKAKSPSCGNGEIYDGTFSKSLISGKGVAAELLSKNGIEIYTENDLDKIIRRLTIPETTLCHIEKDGKVLMLYRNKKKNDYNEGKWIGIGGKVENGETADECVVREVKEETGLTLDTFKKCGVVFFQQKGYIEIMHVYKSNSFSGKVADFSDEGELRWVEKEKLPTLPMWEGDKIFIDLMETTDEFFKVELIYEGDKLVEHTIEL